VGPLVPDIVTTELNLVVALLVGIAFGYILEQAGFSSSRKLTGLFYGTDFTVLRVFFTAGATAMAGVLLLTKIGVLDASVIYVNPTFIQSALIGGAIMGVGFVVGGFCPGTSFCAAAVGRIDGMLFVAGGFAGVFAFGEAFPAVRNLYQAGSLGDVTIPARFGFDPGWLAVGTVLVAISAFVVTGRIERRVTGRAVFAPTATTRHAFAALTLLIAAAAVALMPDVRARMLARASDDAYRRANPVARMTPDELAFRIVDRDPSLVIVDVRPAADFAKRALPGAISLAAADLFGRSLPGTLSQAHRRKVFVGGDVREAETVAALARLQGIDNVAVLDGGMAEFQRTILQPPVASQVAATDVAAFRSDAAREIAAMMKARAAGSEGARKPAKKIAGGCGV